MKQLSVIVPVYRVEPYLAKCLDSILAQDVPDMEILVVDDGSPDQCYAIMEDYAQRYPAQIRIFRKPNGGLSDARNFGLARAEGEYIAFVDSDDYLAPGMYRAMLDKAASRDFDMVVCDLQYVYPDGRTMRASSQVPHDLSSPEEVRRSMLAIYPAAWNKVFHRRMFTDGIRFQKGVWFEDVEFLYRLYPAIRSIGVIAQPFYQYVQRAGAITSTFDRRLFDYLKNWDSILAAYREASNFSAYEKELQYCCMRYLYATFLKGAAWSGDAKIFWEAYREARRFVRRHFSRPACNRYFYTTGPKGLYLLTMNRLSALFTFLRFRRK